MLKSIGQKMYQKFVYNWDVKGGAVKRHKKDGITINDPMI